MVNITSSSYQELESLSPSLDPGFGQDISKHSRGVERACAFCLLPLLWQAALLPPSLCLCAWVSLLEAERANGERPWLSQTRLQTWK